MSDNLTFTAPEKIYLLVDYDLATGNTPDVFPENHGAVSWETEQQKGTVEYVRADLVPFHALIETMDTEALKARIAFLEMALDQAITMTEMEFVPSHDRDEKAVPDCICWNDGYTNDMTHVEQLGVYLEEKW